MYGPADEEAVPDVRRPPSSQDAVDAGPAPVLLAEPAADAALGLRHNVSQLAGRLVGRRSTMRRDSLARLAADGFGLATSLVTATLTAHALGPAGKGYLATLTLLAMLIVVAFEAGIGDAMTVLVGLGRAELQEAAGATVRATLALAAGGLIAFLCLAAVVVAPLDGDDPVVLGLAGALVATGIWYSTLVSVLLTVKRVALVAALSAVSAAITTIVLAVLAIGSRLDPAGAVAASLAGSSVAALATAAGARRAGISLRPRHTRGYLGPALRLGLGFQVPSLLVVASSRLDLLLVYELSGATAAGTYSVALTIAALVVAIPTAIAYAAFPRLSRVDEAQARVLTARVLRHGIVGALLSALVLGAITPVVVPWAFGDRFNDAIAPTRILLLGSVAWSAQWLLGRCASARGATRMLVVSFGLGFAVMIGLDVILIPAHGALGAAVAALVSSTAGATVAGAIHIRSRTPPSRPRA